MKRKDRKGDNKSIESLRELCASLRSLRYKSNLIKA